jgi:hypothetical protein
MKKIYLMIFALVFISTAFTTIARAKTPLTCGAAGTEGMQRCNAVNNNGKCCVPSVYKGAKTVVKSSEKSNAVHNITTQSTTAQHYNTTSNIAVTTPKVVSVTTVVNKVDSAQTSQAVLSPATPAVSASAAAKAAGASSAAKSSK